MCYCGCSVVSNNYFRKNHGDSDKPLNKNGSEKNKAKERMKERKSKSKKSNGYTIIVDC